MIKRKRLQNENSREEKANINEHIKETKLRVVDPESGTNSVIDRETALSMARDRGLDLVLVSTSSNPPVAKIIDYGKFKFDQKKKVKPQPKLVTKEIKMGPNIGSHDLDTKLNHLRKFIQSGNKVKVVITFKGRGIVHKDLGSELLNTIKERTSDIAVQEETKQEGRHMVSVFSKIS